MKFSEKLAAAMHEKKISIRELSEQTGIPKSAIQRYTSGDTEKIPIDRMKKMSEVLGMDPAYVMGWEVDDPGPAQEKLHQLKHQIVPPSLSAKMRGLSEGLVKMERDKPTFFDALYTYIITAYPDYFDERTDDDDPEP